MTGIIRTRRGGSYDPRVDDEHEPRNVVNPLRRTARFAIVGLLSIPLSCGRAPAPEPVPVNQATCARCGMMISIESQSAEWVASGQETLFYDDIGCLATDAQPRAKGGARFVHVGEGGWALAEKAFYARPAEAATPMGYGVVAFRDAGRAAALDRQGKARAWEDLIRELAAEPPGGRP